MCNGETGRSSYGGTIAILRQPLGLGRPPLSLRLESNGKESNNTLATIEGLEGSGRNDHHIIIHRDGDLRCPVEMSSVLYRFAVPGGRMSFPIAGVDLGIGGEGVVGRRVTVLRGREVIGEGIMGWN